MLALVFFRFSIILYLMGPNPLSLLVLKIISLYLILFGRWDVIVEVMFGLIVEGTTSDLAIGGTMISLEDDSAGIVGVAMTFFGTSWTLETLVVGISTLGVSGPLLCAW